MKNVEGELVKLKAEEEEKEGDGVFGFVSITAFKVLMTCLYEEDVITDLRERMLKAIQ